MPKTEKKSFSLQKKIEQLENIEQYFEKPDMDLEEAIEKHKEALVIAKEILDYLEKAENSLQQLSIRELQMVEENFETDASI